MQHNLGQLVDNLRRAANGDPEIDLPFVLHRAADLLGRWGAAMDAVHADGVDESDRMHREAFEATDVWHKLPIPGVVSDPDDCDVTLLPDS